MSAYQSPAAVVQRQLDAYNARDLDALIATYAADARQYEHPATLLAPGPTRSASAWCSACKNPICMRA